MKLRNLISASVLGLAGLMLGACGGGATTSSVTTTPTPTPGGGTTTTTSNSAPTITGSAILALQAGESYSFTPVASDADGDSLTFSVSNLPSWASFNNSTGRISGTPSTSDVGTYSNIVVSVSDGKATTSLAGFTVTVNNVVGDKSLSVSWTAPSTYEDGSSLAISAIGGYRIYRGTSSSNLQLVADINNNSSANYTLTGLVSGTYYIAVTTYDVNGVESAYSTVVSKTI